MSVGQPSPQTPLPPEPWMRGSHPELDPIRRGVLHALELAGEDAERWCAALTDAQIHARPAGLPSVAFHLRHLVRSLDRLLCYAEDRSLDEAQLAALRSEMDSGEPAAAVLREFRDGLASAERRVLAITPEHFDEPRGIGRKRLPTTIAGLVIHCAEHSQRHIGQAITTAKLVMASRDSDT